MCIMFQDLFRWALVGCDHLVLVSFFWLWTLPGYANKNMSGWNMTPRKTEKRTDVTIDLPKIYWTTHQETNCKRQNHHPKQTTKHQGAENTFVSCTPKQTHINSQISLWKSLVFWNVSMKTPSSNVHLMTPFEDQQGFSTAQGLRKYQGCVVSN